MATTPGTTLGAVVPRTLKLWALFYYIGCVEAVEVLYHRVNVGEVELSVGFAGTDVSNDTVVLLHGFPDGSSTWCVHKYVCVICL